jgi:2-succinyl-5-enolpyruvyl-6-hydroxy-3-cyclohexene-1-carboxylate synthase
VFDVLRQEMPGDTYIHYGNSTPVRYSQLFGADERFTVFSNRGVSGIDGQVSTAAGSAHVTQKINTVITGDLGFLYDSNALMNKHFPGNLKIIMINNGGGGIFRFIPGPDTSGFLEEFFETSHDWEASKICEAFNLEYFRAEDENSLRDNLKRLYVDSQGAALLEIFTTAKTNSDILRDYFKQLKSIGQAHSK